MVAAALQLVKGREPHCVPSIDWRAALSCAQQSAVQVRMAAAHHDREFVCPVGPRLAVACSSAQRLRRPLSRTATNDRSGSRAYDLYRAQFVSV